MVILKVVCVALLLAVIPKNVLSKALDIIPALVIHGGASDDTEENVAMKKEGAKMAARVGYETLMRTGSVVDAVQAAIMFMEKDVRFNAGYGSVLTWEGNVENDASIMNGATLTSGAISLVSDILHPIALARTVMEKSRHSYLAAHGAMTYAAQNDIEILAPGSLVTEQAKKLLAEYKNNYNCSYFGCDPITPPEIRDKVSISRGTVGAVAIDAQGNLAAGTSTGGLTGKMGGRIGDCPILGGGTYADNEAGGISSTGDGESIMRFNVASKILHLIKFYGMTAQEATTQVTEQMSKRFPTDVVGVISIDRKGNLGIHFTSECLLWAYQRGKEVHNGFYEGEEDIEIVEEPPENV